MPRALHTKPFAWDQRGPILPVWKKLVASPEKAPAKAAPEKKPAGIALIAGYNSGSDSDDDEEEEAAKPAEPTPPKAGTKRKMQIHVKPSARSKVGRTSEVASIFKENDGDDDEGEPQQQQQPKLEAKRDKHGRKIYETATGKPRLDLQDGPTGSNHSPSFFRRRL